MCVTLYSPYVDICVQCIIQIQVYVHYIYITYTTYTHDIWYVEKYVETITKIQIGVSRESQHVQTRPTQHTYMTCAKKYAQVIELMYILYLCMYK